ncbi:oligosaccharide flippase family protein [Patescibacteria group bacterium]|nr:oligosaccharide flippase family protein [Patescibacteria group bacterium]
MKNKFIKSSIILFIGSITAYAGAYFFHLALGRILSPAEYGTLGALLSIYLIISVPLSAIQNTAAKIFSQLADKYQQINHIYLELKKYLNYISIISFFVFLVIALLLFNYLSLDSYIGLFLIGLTLLFMFKLSWNRGLMQGLFDFTDLSISFAIEGITKLILGITIGLLFMKADYTILAVTLSILTAYLLSIFYTNKIQSKTKSKTSQPINLKEIIIEALRMIAGLAGVLFFISIDVILAKKYLSAYEAGLYTALSTLGKIVFFAPLSIAQVLFPYASQEKNKTTRLALMRNALLMVIAIVAGITVIYFVFPDLIFGILFGDKYGQVGNLLGLIGIAVGVISVVQLIINYLLSQPGWVFVWALLISVICQTTAYTLWHYDVSQFVLITLATSVVYLFATSIAFFQTEKI